MKTTNYWRRAIAACSVLGLGLIIGLPSLARPPAGVDYDSAQSIWNQADQVTAGPTGFAGNFFTDFEDAGYTLGYIVGKPGDPDPTLNWGLSTAGSLIYGAVSDANPAGGSTKHLRLGDDPARPRGGTFPAFRVAARIPGSAVAAGFTTDTTPINMEMDMSITHDPDVGGGATYVIQPQYIAGGYRTLRIYFVARNPVGQYKILVEDFNNAACGASGACDTGVQYNAAGVYKKFRVEFNPCFNQVKYYYDVNPDGSPKLIWTGEQYSGPKINQFLVYHDNGDKGSTIDIDNLDIIRKPLTGAVCGDGLIDACFNEECEATADAACPGRCVDCVCTRTGTGCSTADPVENGVSAAYLTHGGYFTYTADTEFITIDTCDSDFDTELFWDLGAVGCDPSDPFNVFAAATLNDECANVSWGGFQQRGAPNVACYVGGTFGDVGTGFNGLSCLCIPTVPGAKYNFAVLAYGSPPTIPTAGRTTVLNINKKLDCTEAGICANSCNGTCPTAATCDADIPGVCGLGVCGSGICEGTCQTGTVGAPCKGDAVCDVAPTPIVPGVCEGECVAGLPPGTSCKGNASCDIIPGDGSGICGLGFCQVSLLPCMGDFECPPTGGDPGIAGICEGTCNQGAVGTVCKGDSVCDIPGMCTVGSPGAPCIDDAECNQCTAGTVGPKCPGGTNAECDYTGSHLCTAPASAVGDACVVNADCRRCSVGNVGAFCAASADCLRCTRGPNVGAVCTVATQGADCAGTFCSIGDVGALCTTNADCTVEGEKVPGGACCDGWTGICTDAVADAAACTALSLANGSPAQATFSQGKLCEFEPLCVRHSGACCDGSPKAEHCFDKIFPPGRVVYPEDCTGPNQTWWKGAMCDDVPSVCPALTLGACCNTLAGTCTDNETVTSCGDTGLPDDQRVFTLDGKCLNVTCSAVLGACCDEDPFGGCTETTVMACDCMKCVWHKLQTCAQIDCVHNPIPTVSEWGIVVLTLLLLVGAKVYFGRRQTATA